MMRLCGEEAGVNCGSRNITNIRYADDNVLIATSEKDLQILLNRTITESRKYCMQLNEKKVTVVTKKKENLPHPNNGWIHETGKRRDVQISGNNVQLERRG